jgi:hypothetical protein
MEYVFEFGGSPEDVTVTASGIARVSKFRHMLEQLCDDARFQPGMKILLDLCALDMSEVADMEVVKIGHSLDELQDRCQGCALAVVCPDPLAAALMRHAELAERAKKVHVWFAWSRDEARTWLESRSALLKR